MMACCTGCRAGAFASFFCFAYHSGKPSSVVMDLPRTAETGVTHERVSAPFTRTEQEPHWDRPQPNRGPCRCRSPERTYSRGVSGSAATLCVRPFTRIWISSAISDLRFRRDYHGKAGADWRLVCGGLAGAKTLQFGEQ